MEIMKELMRIVITFMNDLVAMFVALTIVMQRAVIFKEVVLCYVTLRTVSIILRGISYAIEKTFTKKEPEEQKD